MYRLTCKIIIGDYQFDFVNEVEIVSTWQRLTDTCTIKLPRRIAWKDKKLRDLIKRGDKVEVWLGWDFEDKLEFRGYVSEIGSKIPTEIKCEDGMWPLKQTNVTKAWRSVSLKTMLREILPASVELVTVGAELGPFRISKVSVAKVLEKLRELYGFCAFFRQGVLYVGFPYSLTKEERRVYQFEKNIISDNLVYRREDDVKLKVRAISIQPNGTKIEKEFGDPDGEERTLHFYHLSEGQLKASAEEEMKRLRYTGYRGSFEAFGQPECLHGDVAVISGGEYPERAGEYLVDKVTTRFGLNGFKREIELGKKA
jgi:hypothetical protein